MISIAIPVYKSKFLDNAINSVINQSYKNFELIILNDKSPDDIISIVKSFDDKRIRYYENQKNIGRNNLVQVWNQCLALAKNDLFILFSDDDIYEPTFIEELVNLSEKYPKIDVFHTRVKQIDEKGIVFAHSPLCPEFESGIDFIWHTIKEKRLQFAPDFMSRTKALKKNGGFVDLPLAWGSDYMTWFNLAQPNGVAYSNKALCSWRISSTNISSIGNIEMRLSAIMQYEQKFKELIYSLQANTSTEKQLLIEIKQLLPSFFKNKKRHLLILNSKSKSIFSHIFLFFRLRKNQKLTIDLLIISLLKKIKTIIR